MTSGSSLLEHLNPAQREAVTHEGGPLLVIAGAGSGKTRVITHRIAWMIRERGVKPWQVLAVTFTNKAAGEMKERLGQLIGSRANQVWLSTFHSFGARFMRREGNRMGLSHDFPILDNEDRIRVLSQVLTDLDIKVTAQERNNIGAHISKLKNQGTDPSVFWAEVEERVKQYPPPLARKWRQTAKVYEEYERKRASLGALDFDDLLIYPITLLESFPDVLEVYRQRFVHVLVDEYQDTNRLQYRLCALLGSAYRNLCVVGDDDQSIYAWRGADIRNVLEFERDFGDARVIRLEENYRSEGTILEAANGLITHNKGRLGKTLRCTRGKGRSIKILTGMDAEDEAQRIVREFRILAGERAAEAQKQPDFGQFAVLYRTVAQSRALEEAFLSEGIPYRVVGGLRFYERKEIKDALAYLRLAVRPDDEMAMERAINFPPRGFGPKAMEALANARRELERKEGRPFSTCSVLERAEGVEGLSRTSIKEGAILAKTVMEWRGTLERESFPISPEGGDASDETIASENREGEVLSGFLRKIVKESGLLGKYQEMKNEKGQTALENLQEMAGAAMLQAQSVARHLASEFPDRTQVSLIEAVRVYLELVALASAVDVAEERKEAVSLMTLHNAKGLEFPVVAIAGVEEGLLPHALSMDERMGVEEERRLFYVGMTRARDQLILSHAMDRFVRGEFSPQLPSRFLVEIPQHLLEYEQKHRPYRGRTPTFTPRFRVPSISEDSDFEEEAPSVPKAAPPVKDLGFSEGDEVRHRTFGTGTVMKIEPVAGTHRVTVDFERFGTKMFLQRVAQLRKV